ncbi:MAG: hypothetical protein SVX38_14055 [Chloroflexota bacterium]|nr:hypothetical protein [Chloroflexota bacterium]
MPRCADYTAFAGNFIAQLPPLELIKARDSTFWDLLEVNADRIFDDANDVESVKRILSPIGSGGLQTLCLWAGLDPLQKKADLRSALADSLGSNLESPGYQTVILINEFLYRRRPDAIEAICRLVLPEPRFNLVRSSDIDSNSKRLCYAILAFVQNPHLLRLLMLFESAERAGYTRYVLIPKMEAGEEAAELAQQHIDAGADLSILDVGKMNDILEDFELRHGQQESLCLETFRDDESGLTLVFILRYLRESLIREVESVVFAAEAELIMLRLRDGMRVIEESSASGVGVPIATAIASELLGDPNVQYIEDTKLTRQEDAEKFIDALANAKDARLRFQELYLESAPVEEAPTLILRCEKSQNLSSPLEFLRQKNIDLLQDLNSIRKLNVAFVTESTAGKKKAYIFRVYCKQASPGRYFLPYSAANISTRIRSKFEAYVRGTYNVQVVPGTG